MRTTTQMSITLPKEMAESVKKKVASGEYASESEVIREGLRTLLARDRVIEDWLRTRVVATCDAMMANPGRGVSTEHIRSLIAQETTKVREIAE